jgi:hypothetical protein
MQIQKISFKNNVINSQQNENSVQSSVKMQPDKFESSTKKEDTKKYILIGAGVAAFALAATKYKSIAKLFSSSSNRETSAATNNSSLNNIKENKSIIPEYLYHMTSKENYESMLKDGHIRKSSMADGIYLSDIKSLITKYPIEDMEGMVKWYAGHSPLKGSPKSPSNTVVLLRIPTKDLKNKLTSVRRIQLMSQGEANDKISQEWLNAEKVPTDKFEDFDKNAKEYLYGDTLPIKNIELINSVKIPKELIEERKSKRPIKTFIYDFLKEMFKEGLDNEKVLIGQRFNWGNPDHKPM